MDVGYSGPMFTWSNKQVEQDLVRVRLDRAVVNGEFQDLFDDIWWRISSPQLQTTWQFLSGHIIQGGLC
jgi:hypothetical protein